MVTTTECIAWLDKMERSYAAGKNKALPQAARDQLLAAQEMTKALVDIQNGYTTNENGLVEKRFDFGQGVNAHLEKALVAWREAGGE